MPGEIVGFRFLYIFFFQKIILFFRSDRHYLTVFLKCDSLIAVLLPFWLPRKRRKRKRDVVFWRAVPLLYFDMGFFVEFLLFFL